MRRHNTGFWVHPREEARQQEAFDLQVEAWRLLALVGAEFSSDPSSVACFDLRIVERLKMALEKRKDLERCGVVTAILTEGRTNGAL
jgi:hypothetical protein